VHKTANIVNKMPKGLRTKAKGAPQEIWLEGTKEDTVTALETFVKTYQVKYQRAADCLIKDRDALRAFNNFRRRALEAHTNDKLLESTFAIVRHRTLRRAIRASSSQPNAL
jgi:transposase-like protein